MSRLEDRDCRGRNAARGFTLIELLVVIAIIALLVSILLPSLRTARQLAMAAMCGSNQHAMFLAGSMYAADNNGQTGPTCEVYTLPYNNYAVNLYFVNPTNNVSWQFAKMPMLFDAYGDPFKPFADYDGLSPAWTIQDFYVAMGMIPGSLFHDQRRMTVGSMKHLVLESEIANCPLARNMFPTIASTSAGGYGHVRTTYSASGLIMCYPYNADMTLAADTASPYGHYRDNYYGPYKPEELSDAAVTIWMCDGMDMGDVGATGEEIANIDPANPTTCLSHHQVDAGMTRYIRYHHIAGPGSSCTWRLFGCISSYNDENNPPSVFTPWEYYHENPEAVHWDGHVATYSPPGDDNYSAIRKHLTRDATMGRDMTGG